LNPHFPDRPGDAMAHLLDAYPVIYFLKRPEAWKQTVLKRLFRHKKVVFLDQKLPSKIDPRACVLTWGTRIYSVDYNKILKELTVWNGLPHVRMEAGFFACIGLGAAGGIPFSVCFDDLGIYYDATQPSRLEHLLQNENVNAGVLLQAENHIDYILKHGLSKYNGLPHVDPLALYGEKTKKRVLIAAQVRDDESVVRGMVENRLDGIDLIRIAKRENPEAEIIYKIHPDVLAEYRQGEALEKIPPDCKILNTPCSIHSALQTVDRVYTISSLAGFEALLRKIPVVCFGTPFYSGWGLTDDRDAPCGRRNRQRSLEELFAIAAMMYPDYFDPETFAASPFASILQKLRDGKPAARLKTGKGRGPHRIWTKIKCGLKLGCRLKAVKRKAKNCRAAVWRFLNPADIAYLEAHALMMRVIKNVNKHTKHRIHIIQSGNEHVHYRKVIVPNGLWDYIRPEAEKIPRDKRIYMEVAFFPQDSNVYFDPEGVHGYSSIRHAVLKPLTPAQVKELENFRTGYNARNFVKYAPGQMAEFAADQGKGRYEYPFTLVVLQGENDTAYQLNPFKDNQEMIDFVTSCFSDRKLIFKVHPDDPSVYRVRREHALLPAGNTDLRQLLIHAQYVISVNSTVLLQALMYKKICASLGQGFSTNHHVCLECHQDRERLKELPQWQPDWEKVDQFLYFLLCKQISVRFWEDPKEKAKLEQQFRFYGLAS
jgi:capsular polysaccharide export protein